MDACLSELQLGHLRHIENLAAQPDGDWSFMGNAEPGQEWLDSYRYQLAKMHYALGLAHFHRLPAAPCVFQSIMQALVRKMLRRDVWGYWKDTSQSGRFVNPDLDALRAPWIDPVVRENIMYSGHLHAMTGMYAVLFDDDRYALPGALTFTYAPIFFGMGPQQFEYDFPKLTDTIYWQMVENGWLGVACEPNCVFLICNQFPLLGFRFHDLRHGTTLATEATASYRAAWQDKGMLDEHGDFIWFWRQQQDEFVKRGRSASDSWLGAVMNAWDPELVRAVYARQSREWFQWDATGAVSVRPDSVVQARRAAGNHNTRSTIIEDRGYTFNSPEFGYGALWAAEMGDEELLEGLLLHADRYMNPSWHRGGLYYPRNDRSWDDVGHMTYMDPLSGNALLAYARLNVEDGLRGLYAQPWGAAHFAAPALTAMAPRLDVLRARFDATSRVLSLTVRARESGTIEATLTVAPIPAAADWSVLRDGVSVATSARSAGDAVQVIVEGDRMTLRLALANATDVSIRWSAA